MGCVDSGIYVRRIVVRRRGPGFAITRVYRKVRITSRTTGLISRAYYFESFARSGFNPFSVDVGFILE